MPGVRRGADRRRARRRQDRQSHLRLDDPFQGRLADEDGAASGDRRAARPAMSAIAVAVVVAETLAQAKDAAEKVKVDYEVLPAVTDPAKAQARARRRSTTSRRTTRSTSGTSATRRRPRPRSRRRSTSPSSTSSTTAWCRTRWSRASRSANTTPATTAFTLWNTIAEPACRAAGDRGLRRHGARAQAARDRAGRRRRLRLEDLHLSRRGRLPLGVEEGRPAGEMDLRPLRGVPRRRARPRPRHPRRDGVRRRRQDHRRCRSRPSPISAPTCRPSRRRCRPISTRTLLSGQYDIPAIYCEVDAVYTNTVPVDAYRGAGRPEATFVVERLVEVGARELGIDPADLRKKNFIKSFPHQTPVIMTYDAGDYHASLKKAHGDRRREGLRQAQARQSRAQRQAARHRLFDLYRGLRHRAVAGGRLARRRRRPVGIRRGAGQSDRLGRGPDRLPQPRPGPRDDVRAARLRAARHPDRERQRSCTATPTRCSSAWAPTARAPARSACRRSSRRSTRSRPRPRRSRPSCWKPPKATSSSRTASSPSPAPTSRRPGAMSRSTPISRTSSPARELEPGLKEGAFYDPTNFTFPAGCHICEVEIDPETGDTEIVGWTAVDDFGIVINPMIVEGQVHGGVAQGVGQALLEGAVYDKDGQLVTGSFMDYSMPRADNLPSLKVDTTDDEMPVQSARHQGLRRGGRDRGAGGGDQRHHRRDRHRGFGHAGDAPGGLGGDPARPRRCNRQQNRIKETHDVRIHISPPDHGPAGGQPARPRTRRRSCSPAAIR